MKKEEFTLLENIKRLDNDMQKEIKIKEILDRLDFNEWEVDLYKVPITWCELYNIRDYITNLQTIEQQYSVILSENAELENKITNLQEKYERMKENAEILSNGYNELEKRNEKAIEYIKQLEHSEWITFGRKILLDILNGGDDNE